MSTKLQVHTLNRNGSFIVTKGMIKSIGMANFQYLADKATKTIRRAAFTRIAYFFVGLSFITLSSCEQETQVVFVVETSLQDYFERFVNEASIRGINVAQATSHVHAEISDIPEQNVIGQCAWNESYHAITIDRQYWQSANDLQREFVVFHELGHCVLKRNHVDEADGNGNCESIMTSGTGSCRVVYTSQNRERLVDELFTY